MNQEHMRCANSNRQSEHNSATAQSNLYQSSREHRGRLYLNIVNCTHAEIVKFFGVTSTWWLMGITVVLPMIFAAIEALVMRVLPKGGSINIQGEVSTKEKDALEQLTVHLTQETVWNSLIGVVTVSIIVISIFAVMSITTEYSTGAIQTALVVNPHRGMFYAAKAIAMSLIVFFSSMLSAALTWMTYEIMYMGINLAPLPSQAFERVVLALIGFPLMMVLLAIMNYGFGAICRNTAGGIMCGIGMSMILPTLIGIITVASAGAKWVLIVRQMIPTVAISDFIQGPFRRAAATTSMTASNASAFDFSWWQSGLITFVWALVLYGIGMLIVKKRDI